jgi:hypothetical protein
VEKPLVFVTELVAFFQTEGWAGLLTKDAKLKQPCQPFFAFSRAAYGLVRFRTDGQRLLICTDSGKVRTKETYAFQMDSSSPAPANVVKV